jgi:hypothetical protein
VGQVFIPNRYGLSMARVSTSPDYGHEKKLTSDVFAAFKDSVEAITMLSNQSGRLSFVRQWPHASAFILGEQLMGFDRDGTQDHELRSQLEEEAEGRRLGLLDVLKTLEKDSVFEGTLQLDYIKDVVMSLGRDIALYIYAEHLVDRFIPPPPKPVDEEVIAEVQPIETNSQHSKRPAPPVIPTVIPTNIAVAEEEFTAIEEDPLHVVQPIDMLDQPAPSVSGVTFVPTKPAASEEPSDKG